MQQQPSRRRGRRSSAEHVEATKPHKASFTVTHISVESETAFARGDNEGTLWLMLSTVDHGCLYIPLLWQDGEALREQVEMELSVMEFLNRAPTPFEREAVAQFQRERAARR